MGDAMKDAERRAIAAPSDIGRSTWIGPWAASGTAVGHAHLSAASASKPGSSTEVSGS